MPTLYTMPGTCALASSGYRTELLLVSWTPR